MLYIINDINELTIQCYNLPLVLYTFPKRFTAVSYQRPLLAFALLAVLFAPFSRGIEYTVPMKGDKILDCADISSLCREYVVADGSNKRVSASTIWRHVPRAMHTGAASATKHSHTIGRSGDSGSGGDVDQSSIVDDGAGAARRRVHVLLSHPFQGAFWNAKLLDRLDHSSSPSTMKHFVASFCVNYTRAFEIEAAALRAAASPYVPSLYGWCHRHDALDQVVNVEERLRSFVAAALDTQLQMLERLVIATSALRLAEFFEHVPIALILNDGGRGENADLSAFHMNHNDVQFVRKATDDDLSKTTASVIFADFNARQFGVSMEGEVKIIDADLMKAYAVHDAHHVAATASNARKSSSAIDPSAVDNKSKNANKRYGSTIPCESDNDCFVHFFEQRRVMRALQSSPPADFKCSRMRSKHGNAVGRCRGLDQRTNVYAICALLLQHLFFNGAAASAASAEIASGARGGGGGRDNGTVLHQQSIAEIRVAMSKCMEHEPDDRWSSKQVHDHLRNVLLLNYGAKAMKRAQANIRRRTEFDFRQAAANARKQGLLQDCARSTAATMQWPVSSSLEKSNNASSPFSFVDLAHTLHAHLNHRKASSRKPLSQAQAAATNAATNTETKHRPLPLAVTQESSCLGQVAHEQSIFAPHKHLLEKERWNQFKENHNGFLNE